MNIGTENKAITVVPLTTKRQTANAPKTPVEQPVPVSAEAEHERESVLAGR